MQLLDYWFELTAMGMLVAVSGFFSGSEAALFSLSRSDCDDLAKGTRGERQAAALLSRPESLLTAILFWNLLVNMANFALTAVVAARFGGGEQASSWRQALFTVGSLATIILFSEVLPKSLAVIRPRWVSRAVSLPLTVAMKLVAPILPALQAISDALARLLLPNLEAEPLMELADLERAVAIQSHETVENETLLIQERQVLARLVELADTTAAEMMRPRRRCLVVSPPVSLESLRGRVDGVGEYVLVTGWGSDEIAAALPLNRLGMLPPERLDLRAEPLSVVPWCAPASMTLNQLRQEGRRVAVVINELGESIGVVALEQLLDAVLRDTSRIDPNDAHGPALAPIDDNAWAASGETPLKRVAKGLGPWVDARDDVATTSESLTRALVEARSLTVAGLLQEQLQRPLHFGDEIHFEGLRWAVVGGAVDDIQDDPIAVRIEPSPRDDSHEPGAPRREGQEGAP